MEKAEGLLHALRPESPLRLRLATELEEKFKSSVVKRETQQHNRPLLHSQGRLLVFVSRKPSKLTPPAL